MKSSDHFRLLNESIQKAQTEDLTESAVNFKSSYSQVKAIEEADAEHAGRLEHALVEMRDGLEEYRSIQEEFFELRQRLQDAIRTYSPDEVAYWEAYGLAQLAIVIGSDEYATHDRSINNLISSLEDEYQETKDDYAANGGEEDDEFEEAYEVDEGKPLGTL